jgi:hypothetical protein
MGAVTAAGISRSPSEAMTSVGTSIDASSPVRSGPLRHAERRGGDRLGRLVGDHRAHALEQRRLRVLAQQRRRRVHEEPRSLRAETLGQRETSGGGVGGVRLGLRVGEHQADHPFPREVPQRELT